LILLPPMIGCGDGKPRCGPPRREIDFVVTRSITMRGPVYIACTHCSKLYISTAAFCPQCGRATGRSRPSTLPWAIGLAVVAAVLLVLLIGFTARKSAMPSAEMDAAQGETLSTHSAAQPGAGEAAMKRVKENP
jgi:hypothetical protein